MRFKMPREFYIPKSSVKVAMKCGSAVAYLFQNNQGKPAAALFIGKQAKPAWRFYFASEAARAKKIGEAFAGIAAHAASKAESKAKAKAEPRLAKVGSIYCQSGGYEQTNVSYYEVVELVGSASVMVREIGRELIETNSSMSGRCVPLPGAFLKNAEPFLVRAKGSYIKVGHRHASLLVPKVIASVPVYESNYVSWYG